MIRPFLYEIVLFALPFLLYFAYQRLRYGGRAGRQAPVLLLVFLGVVSMGIGLVLFAHFGGAPAGTSYIPAYIENGRLVQPSTR